MSHENLINLLKDGDSKVFALLDLLASPALISDEESRILYINRAFEEFSGYSNEEIVGSLFFETLIAPENRDDFFNVFEKIRQADGPYLDNRYIQLKSGEKRLLSGNLSIIQDDAGEIKYILVSGNDISEEKKVEETIKTVNDCLAGLGTDNKINIERILETAKIIMGATFAFFSQWYEGRLVETTCRDCRQPKSITDDGHVWDFCTDHMGEDLLKSIVIHGLQDSKYAGINPCFGIYNAETFIGTIVRTSDDKFGTLGLLFDIKREIKPVEQQALVSLASALGNIVDRRAMTDELKNSNSKYKRIFDNIQDVYYEVKLSGEILEISPSISHMSGYTREELIGTKIHSYYKNPADRTVVIEKLESDGFITDMEIVLVDKDGGERPVSLSSRILFDNDGKHEKIIGTMRDVSERVALFDTLSESETKYRELVNSLPEVICEVDSSGTLTYINDGGLAVFGYTEADLTSGLQAIDFVADQDKSRAMEAMRDRLAGISAENGKFNEYLMVRKDGSTFPVILNSQSMIKNNEVLGFRSLIIDITDRKNAEKEIKKKNYELKRAMEVKSEFMSMVSHELRTPLVPILGYAEMILDGTFGECPDELLIPLKTVLERSEALKKLIEDLLQLSKMEKGTIRFENGPVKLDEFLASIVNTYTDIKHKKIVNINFEASNVVLLADRNRFQQVLHNLIDNAIKYSNDLVNISLSARSENNVGIITVEDNGLGISEDKLDRVFERFFQIEPVLTRSHNGTGLGLAICRDLVELMNGSITVESELGIGTKFTILLPLYLEQKGAQTDVQFADGKGTEMELAFKSGGRSETHTKKTIAVIDDDPFTTSLLKVMLGKDFRVLIAGNGSAGLDLVRLNIPDLILLDWMMPDLDGLAFIGLLKHDKEIQDIPVIFVSGKAETDAVEIAMDAGAVDFVAKPFNKSVLLEKIDLALKNALETITPTQSTWVSSSDSIKDLK